MKNFVTLLIIIFLGVGLYTGYQFVTFQPDEAAPFVFNPPILPPEILEEQKMAEGTSLSADEEKQKDKAVAEAQAAFDYYRDAVTAAPQQSKDILTFLNGKITNWDLPGYFLSAPSAEMGGMRSFEKLNVVPPIMISVDSNQKGLDCSSKTPMANILVGSTGKDALNCAQSRNVTGKSADADVIFIGGPDDDTITDAQGNRIISGGTGDDTITVGAGRSIIILDAAWGHDTLTVDCAGANVKDTEIPAGFPIPWGYKTINFIVLGDGVDPKDVSWKGNVLTSTTGDTLTVNENCFTVVPAAQ